MTKKIKSNNSGITLIALVVTIIVLMILAGIAVAALMGDNGIIKRAGEAKESQRGATVQDEVTLAIAENEMIDQLNSVQGTKEPKKTKTKVVGDLVLKGFLKDKEPDILLGENGETEHDTIKIGSVTIDFSRLGSAKIEYSYDTPYIPTDFTYTEGAWNSGFTIKGDLGTANENDEFVWVPCVTDQSKVKSGDIVQTFEKHFSSQTIETDPNRENLEHRVYGGADRAETTWDEGESAEAIRTSVETYGGFYIAKYEAGVSGTTDNYNLTPKMATNGTVKPLSQAGKGVWNGISEEDVMTVAEAMIPSSTGCSSALISGACWDTTMQWIKQTTGTSYDVNSTGKGNYYEDENTNSWKGGVTTTASSIAYVLNGIYDMAGNVEEFTTEKYAGGGDGCLVQRGGHYANTGSTTPSAWRECGYIFSSSTVGFRVVLFK